MKKVLSLALLALALMICGCEKAQEKPSSKEGPQPAASNSPAPTKPAPSKKEEPGHEVHGHAAEEKPAAAGGHSGEVIDLGTSKLGDYEVRASRDKGDITPGGEAPIDVWIDAGLGEDVAIVRFWIGTEDAKGSVKAKAEIEDGKWHTHAEVPSPLPQSPALWIEIENKKGVKTRMSFDLKL